MNDTVTVLLEHKQENKICIYFEREMNWPLTISTPFSYASYNARSPQPTDESHTQKPRIDGQDERRQIKRLFIIQL